MEIAMAARTQASSHGASAHLRKSTRGGVILHVGSTTDAQPPRPGGHLRAGQQRHRRGEECLALSTSIVLCTARREPRWVRGTRGPRKRYEKGVRSRKPGRCWPLALASRREALKLCRLTCAIVRARLHRRVRPSRLASSSAGSQLHACQQLGHGEGLEERLAQPLFVVTFKAPQLSG